MERGIACTLLVLIISASFSETSNEYDEDVSYDKDFYSYVDNDEWAQDSREKHEWGPLNIRGKLRQRFAIDAALYNPQKSMVCSPLSALIPLGKLAIGAEGDCLSQLLGVIGLSKKAYLAKAFKPLLKSLENLEGVKLSIVSKIYISDKIELKSKFKKRARKIFKTSVEVVDFRAPGKVAKTVNDFVRTKTRNMIKKIIDPNDISRMSSMILINAVYFSGTWEHRFEKVKIDNFFNPAGTRKVPMMTREGRYKYYKSDDLDSQVVEIPYTEGKASFVIVLPNTKHGLPVLLHKFKLAPDLLQRALNNMVSKEMILTIPKFKTEAHLDLKTSYEMLGLTEIFHTRNNGLENIVKNGENIYVSKAIQRAVIEVNEEGTKASAASVIQMEFLSMNLNKIIFNANRPFLYFIKYKREQVFAGVFATPATPNDSYN